MTISETAKRCAEILDEVERVIVGKREVLRLVLLGILASGHVLLEDLPGLGKTMMARSFADVLGLQFTRIQFTPDLLPADVTGAPLYDQRTGDIVFRPGPVFTNLLLADEINRTPPKTQAALLEAMAEQQVTVDGQSRPLPQPFIVLATDNPIEYEGTYPLPEAQLDRFLLRTRLGYLPPEGEAAMLRQRLEQAGRATPLRAVVDVQGLLELRESLHQVHVGDDVLSYVVRLLTATREHPKVSVGREPARRHRGHRPRARPRGGGRPRLCDARGHQGGRRARARAPARAAPGAVGTEHHRRGHRRRPAGRGAHAADPAGRPAGAGAVTAAPLPPARPRPGRPTVTSARRSRPRMTGLRPG